MDTSESRSNKVVADFSISELTVIGKLVYIVVLPVVSFAALITVAGFLLGLVIYLLGIQSDALPNSAVVISAAFAVILVWYGIRYIGRQAPRWAAACGISLTRET